MVKKKVKKVKKDGKNKEKIKNKKKVEGYEGAGGGIGMDDKAQDWKGGEEEESE